MSDEFIIQHLEEELIQAKAEIVRLERELFESRRRLNEFRIAIRADLRTYGGES